MTAGRLAILHIGGEKTGSTTLQATLAANRGALADRGILYSLVAGRTNHHGLALYATEGRHASDLRDAQGLGEDAAFAAFMEGFPDRLRREAEASGARILVFSSEHLSSRVVTVGEVARIRALLDTLAEGVRVVFYARPQEELVAAGWSTMLKSGATDPFDPDRLLRSGTPLDHAAVVERWCTAFPEACWRLRPFQAGQLEGGDVVEDFLAATGLPAEALPRRLPPRNRSLDVATAEFLRRYNLARAGDELRGQVLRGQLIRLLEELSDGPPIRLPPDKAAEVAARHAPGNAAIARRLLGRDTLFEARPDAAASLPALDLDGAMRITAALWRLVEGQGAAP
jgi:hypothetical protein